METAKEKLKKMTAWDTEPALADTELDELLAAAALSDAAGLLPSDPAWQPTYDLDSAAAEGWLIKAGRAAALVESEPGTGVLTSKVFENCRAMARHYDGRRLATFNF